MKFLVTGGGGFVGSYVIQRLLARGDSVRSLGRSAQPQLEALGVEVVQGDLGELNAVQAACADVDAVFHVAAKAGVWGDWQGYYQANVVGTRNVVQACRELGVTRLVYTSTPSVVFNRKSHCGGNEDLPYGRRWLCHYAHTKAIAEQEALAASSDGLKVLALRPHLIFGPGDPHLLPRVLDSYQQGRLRIVGRGDTRVDMTYVGNVADAHLNAMDALQCNPRVAGQAYFISQDEPVMLWPWFNQVLQALGHPPLVRRVPLAVTYTAGALCEGMWHLLKKDSDPPMTRFVALELAKHHYFDISGAKAELGYQPAVSMKLALELTIEDLKRRGYASG